MFATLLGSTDHKKVIDLGCGQGRDAISLALRGFDVTATDLSVVALQRAGVLAEQANAHVEFARLDLSRPPYPWPDSYFSGVFSYLSLHYFPTTVTREIFAEIRRIIRPDGVFLFVVRSTRDPIFGRGEELEPEMFLLDGHIRHFFSIPHARSMMKNWQILNTEELVGHYLDFNQPGGFIRVSASPANKDGL